MRQDRIRNRPESFLSTLLVSTLLMQLNLNVADEELLADGMLMLKKSVCIVQVKMFKADFLWALDP